MDKDEGASVCLFHSKLEPCFVLAYLSWVTGEASANYHPEHHSTASTNPQIQATLRSPELMPSRAPAGSSALRSCWSRVRRQCFLLSNHPVVNFSVLALILLNTALMCTYHFNEDGEMHPLWWESFLEASNYLFTLVCTEQPLLSILSLCQHPMRVFCASCPAQ